MKIVFLYYRAVLMLGLVVLALGAGGCASWGQSPEQQQAAAFADVQAEILAAVADPVRAQRAVDVVAKLEQKFVRSRADFKVRKDRLRELYADYDAPRVEFEREIGGIQQEIQNVNAYFLRLGNDLDELLTEREAKQINKARNKYVESAVKALREV